MNGLREDVEVDGCLLSSLLLFLYVNGLRGMQLLSEVMMVVIQYVGMDMEREVKAPKVREGEKVGKVHRGKS